MRIEVGDIVRVIAPFPDGCSDYTFGDVGVVTEIDSGNYLVVSKTNKYHYGLDQITLAKSYDIADAFRDIIYPVKDYVV